jgi:hypothetical protein
MLPEIISAKKKKVRLRPEGLEPPTLGSEVLNGSFHKLFDFKQ